MNRDLSAIIRQSVNHIRLALGARTNLNLALKVCSTNGIQDISEVTHEEKWRKHTHIHANTHIYTHIHIHTYTHTSSLLTPSQTERVVG